MRLQTTVNAQRVSEPNTKDPDKPPFTGTRYHHQVCSSSQVTIATSCISQFVPNQQEGKPDSHFWRLLSQTTDTVFPRQPSNIWALSLALAIFHINTSPPSSQHSLKITVPRARILEMFK
ncbi:hypothetical protein BaRGS_00024678 [Batillaria attramentaria]|uniref:Uncharacterized protein n=1 Tax=Batillaria attramentaria TaxID=370345 RepID=A0ABD0KAC3_9CAEN